VLDRTRSFAKQTAVLLCAGIALSACTTMGVGNGSESPAGAPVSFTWQSKDGGTTGTMSAMLADGRTFSGTYLQVTSEARSDDFAPMWSGWRHGWSDWDRFPAFTTVYSGRVMANMQSGDGERMRCRFYLNDPVQGMEGGGQGQCQLADGHSVDALFPRV
jgi:hypothetical protein